MTRNRQQTAGENDEQLSDQINRSNQRTNLRAN